MTDTTERHVHYIIIDDERFSLMTTKPFPTTDDDAWLLMTDTMNEMIPFLTHDAQLISQGKFSDDDTDYMPAIANAYAALTCHTAQSDYDPLESLNALLHNIDFIHDMLCLSAQYPIDTLDVDWTD